MGPLGPFWRSSGGFDELGSQRSGADSARIRAELSQDNRDLGPVRCTEEPLRKAPFSVAAENFAQFDQPSTEYEQFWIEHVDKVGQSYGHVLCEARDECGDSGLPFMQELVDVFATDIGDRTGSCDQRVETPFGRPPSCKDPEACA